MRKKIILALFLLILLSTYNFRHGFELNSKLTIKEIIFENNNILKDEKIKKELSFLYETNIFFFKSEIIKTKLKEFQFIESFEIKRIYPDKLRIKIFEKKPIAILQNKKEKNYYTNKGETITFKNLEKFKSLPLVFGEKKSFQHLYEELKSINFPFNEIKTFYLFESKRWDIVTDNNQLIKLPINNYKQSLINFMELKNQVNFKKYKTFDYRIKNQLILK